MAHLRSVSVLVVSALTLLAACSADNDGATPAVELTPTGRRGADLFRSNGCASCHGGDAGGGVGPALAGLYGTEVELSDGSTVIADEEYLFRSIDDPRAQTVAGYNLPMPAAGLSDDEIDTLVAYLVEIGPTGEPAGTAP